MIEQVKNDIRRDTEALIETIGERLGRSAGCAQYTFDTPGYDKNGKFCIYVDIVLFRQWWVFWKRPFFSCKAVFTLQGFNITSEGEAHPTGSPHGTWETYDHCPPELLKKPVMKNSLYTANTIRQIEWVGKDEFQPVSPVGIVNKLQPCMN